MAEASYGAGRELLNALYHAAYSTAHPSTCLPPHLPAVPQGGRIIIIGAGKGTAAMAVATERHYIAAGQAGSISGTISTRHGFALPTEIIRIIEAGHPVPDANSIEGAKFAIELAKSAGPNDLVLCLLSGGASALWSAPVDGVSFEAKQQLTKQLLKSGAPISEMNCVRKHLSRIKGGKLAAATHPARLLTVAISDVPGDHPDEIGSGPTVADRSTLSDARNVLARWNITPSAEIAAALNNPANETMKLAIPNSLMRPTKSSPRPRPRSRRRPKSPAPRATAPTSWATASKAKPATWRGSTPPWPSTPSAAAKESRFCPGVN